MCLCISWVDGKDATPRASPHNSQNADRTTQKVQNSATKGTSGARAAQSLGIWEMRSCVCGKKNLPKCKLLHLFKLQHLIERPQQLLSLFRHLPAFLSDFSVLPRSLNGSGQQSQNKEGNDKPPPTVCHHGGSGVRWACLGVCFQHQ